jgi:hypothetical protein
MNKGRPTSADVAKRHYRQNNNLSFISDSLSGTLVWHKWLCVQRPYHMESFANNHPRARCDSILRTIRPATLPDHIIKATLCRHGQNNKSSGDPFKFSCIKIRSISFDVIPLSLIFYIKNQTVWFSESSLKMHNAEV